MALMAVKGVRPQTVKKVGSSLPRWTFESGRETLAGGDKKFVFGSLKGKTFIDVTLEHPEQSFANCRRNTLSKDTRQYVAWIEKSFEVGKDAKQIRVKEGTLPAANATVPCP